MMIKKALYISTLLISLVLSNSAFADNMITVSGLVKDNSCTIDGDSTNLTVHLMENNAKQFRVLGASSPAVPFHITLSSCGSAVKAVKVGYSGIADDINPALLKLDDGVLAAAGLGIQLLNGQQEMIPLNAASNDIPWTGLIASQTHTLSFYARLIATRIPITAGHVNATTTLMLEFQ